MPFEWKSNYCFAIKQNLLNMQKHYELRDGPIFGDVFSACSVFA